MELRVLGPVQVVGEEGERLVPAGSKQRLLLAALLHRAPRVASVDQLSAVLWPTRPPEDPPAALRTQISRLRSFLAAAGAGADALRSEPYGYRLDVPPETVDVQRFEATLERANRAEEPARKLALLEEALALWRGAPYEEFADLIHFSGEVTRLRELRAGARERQVECLLACGRTSDALSAAEHLVHEDPLRERPRALLMTALYEAGRQHEALATFQEYRRLLAEELGLDPSPALRQLESEILRHEHLPLSPQAVLALRTPRAQPLAPAEQPAGEGGSGPELMPQRPEPPLHSPPPVPLTRLIGREQEVSRVLRLLDSGRLLTLTGAGGSGKTRLALEVAAQHREAKAREAAWVALEGLTDPQLLAQEVAAGLGIREQAGRSGEDVVLQVLKTRELLLCLDNCEHLIDACAHLAETLLRGCAGLTILATSREPLGIPGERTWPVPPLPIPDEGVDDPEALERFAAVRLFVERASAARPAFALTHRNAAAVAQICRRLDGIPLALELAAARVRTLPVEQIVERLDRRFQLLTAGSRTALPRHQTLHAAIDWSYQLLSARERRLLEELSVFAGGFTLAAVEAVCSFEEADPAAVVDLFAALCDRSLVVMSSDPGSARYRLLETIREYARERLEERGDGHLLRQRHADHFTRLAEEAEPHLLGGKRREWVDRLSEEQDNLRAALRWTRSAPGAASLHVRLAASLWWTWHAQGHVSEARAWSERALLLPEASQPDGIRARLLYGAAMAAWLGGDLTLARERAEEALGLARALGDERALTRALSVSAWVLRDSGELDRAVALVDENVRIAHAAKLSPTELAFALWLQGSVHHTVGDLDTARTAQEEAAAIWRREGVRWGLSQALHGLAIIALNRDELEDAARLCREAITELRDERDVYWTCRGLEGLAAVLARQGQSARAARLLGAAEALREPIGTPLLAFETPRYEQTVEMLRTQMGAAEFAAAWAQGRTSSLEQAVAYALETEGAAHAQER